MKIDSNTTVEEVKEKTKDSLDGLCNIKNNESDNGKTSKELFDTYRTGRLSTSRKSFSEYDFIRLFLSFLIKNNTIKFDIATLGYDLIEFYDDENFKELFDMPIKHQIEGDFVELSICLQEAMLGGIISAISIQNTNDRLILLNKEEADDIINSYESKYIDKMKQLVDNYIKKIKFKNFQTFSCGDTKVTFDNDGYIVKAKGFIFVMWSTQNQEQELIGKHIIELAKILKKYSANQENYISFLENVVLKFYEKKTKDNITKDCRTCQNMSCRVEQNEKPVAGCFGYINHKQDNEEKGNQLVKTIKGGK